jgi:glycosidase
MMTLPTFSPLTPLPHRMPPPASFLLGAPQPVTTPSPLLTQAPVVVAASPQPAVSDSFSRQAPAVQIPVQTPPQLPPTTSGVAAALSSLPGVLFKPSLQASDGVHQVVHPQRTGWTDRNREMFKNGEAIIYALNIRTFGAKDHNKNGRIDPDMGESGTFLSAIDRLPELKALGVNTVHVLPINPVGKTRRLGQAGSVYAASDLTTINPQFVDPKNPLSPVDQARVFVNAAHQQGIHVVMDVPSCGSYDLLKTHPELFARDAEGKLMTPYNWIDILMFKNGPQLLAYYDKFFDLMVNKIGVDGFRCDVARARPLWFWKALIDKYRSVNPGLGFLAESYIQEDQSPINNIPSDNPYGLLNVGFDMIYGQFHNFPAWNSDDYVKYMLEARSRTLHQAGTGKTFLGSFYTHDDHSMMGKGGPPIMLLATGLMHTQPWTNPYYIDGFLQGDPEDLDIFNYAPPPGGQHPEIAEFAKQMTNLRGKYKDVILHGSFIPFTPTKSVRDKTLNKDVIAFARHLNGQTLLTVANKNVNARTQAAIRIPGWTADEALKTEAPAWWRLSEFRQSPGLLEMNLEPGAFFAFPIRTPDLGKRIPDPLGDNAQLPPEAVLSNQPWAKTLQEELKSTS